MDGKDAKRQGRYTQFAMAATNLALEDAKLDAEALEKVDKDKFGVLIGSGIGGVEFFENNCNKFNEAGAGAKGLKKVQNNHLLRHRTNRIEYTLETWRAGRNGHRPFYD